MAMTAAGPFWCPQVPYGPTASAPALNGLGIAASGQKAAYIVQAPKTGNIRKIHMGIGTVTTPTDTDVRVETVDASTGDPSGSLWAANTNVTLASGSIVANTWVTTSALTADASVTKGDLLAVVVVPTGSPNYNVNRLTAGTSGGRLPYMDKLTAGTWAKVSDGNPVLALEYSDGSFGDMYNVYPISAINTHTYNSGSTPDEYALKFSFPVPVRAAGLWLWADQDGDFDAVLYDSDGTTALMTISFDKDNRQGTSAGFHFLRFDDSVSLTANTAYRLAIRPSTVTSLTIYSMDVSAASLLDQMPGGQNLHHSTRTNAGAWTDTTTRRLFMGLMIDGVDDGAGGGGGTTFVYSVTE